MPLSTPLQAYPPRHPGAVPPIMVWLALSLLLHLAALLWTPRMQLAPSAEPGSTAVTVFLRPQPPPEVAPPPAPEPAPPPTVITPKPALPRQQQPPPPPRMAKAPPVITLDKPKPDEPPAATVAPKVEEPPAAPPPPAPAAKAVPPAPEGDLTAYIEARRRARGESPAEAPATDAERANRGALNSAGLKQALPTTFNPPRPRNGYGSFEIRRRGHNYAEFLFKGWNENFRRDGSELIEVRQGSHASIDLAVIRNIIEIIRRTESGDFTWHSHRLGRSLVLSARARDNAGLEEFMMQEFYDDLHRYR